MKDLKYIIEQLDKVNEKSFEEIALLTFKFQYKNNLLYRTYVDNLHRHPDAINSIIDIPFLPISFFKSHNVKSGTWRPEVEFTSSGTTGLNASRHAVYELDFYLRHSVGCFETFFGSIKGYHFLALLPSYLERSGSSLIAMIDHFIQQDETGHSGFYLKNEAELLNKISLLKKSDKKIILWGVTFALVELAEKFDVDLSHCIIIETGGMKGKRKELTRDELHLFLCEKFKVNAVCSEYGMTELMSQAYSLGNGYFQCPPGMKVVLREINDPFNEVPQGKAGAINMIDLANAHSCSFIETEDLGRITEQGFEVLGRMDNSDVRGCNLLVG